MKTTSRILVTVLCVILVSSCGKLGSLKSKPLPEDKLDYAGYWVSSEMKLSITKGGRVEYERSKGAGKKSISAPIQKWEGDDFIVGALGITTRFEVSETPNKDSTGTWHMTVDGVRLTRMTE